MKRLLLLILFASFCFYARAQNLYWPRDVKRAYKKMTRSNDGWPGKNYWQNTARYTITVTALPPNMGRKSKAGSYNR